MAQLGEAGHFSLSYSKVSQVSRKTFYHVKLTDSALRTLQAFRNLKISLPKQSLISFRGNRGYIKIPDDNYPNGLRVFSFDVSNDSKDKPHSGFDCIRQNSCGGQCQLGFLGSIQDKITICATDDSYQATRDRVTQVEKESWSRTAIEIKPGATYRSKGVNVAKKPGLCSISKGLNFRKSSPASPTQMPKKAAATSTLTHRALRERLIHLLALKPFRKPELILWLEREGAHPRDKTELPSLLDEVAKLNPKENSYSLKEELYRLVQTDWPGYSKEDRQLLHRLLLRKQPSSVNQSLPPNPRPLESPNQPRPHKHPLTKRSVPSDTVDLPAHKKPKAPDSSLQPDSIRNWDLKTLDIHTSNAESTSCGLHYTEALHSQSSSPESGPQEPQDKHRRRDGASVHKDTARHSAQEARPPSRAESELPGVNCKRKKGKKHRERQQARTEEEDEEDEGEEECDWREVSPTHIEDQSVTEGEESTRNSAITPSPVEIPDYLVKYSDISCTEQCQHYKEDFSAEFDEYLHLHTRIGGVTERFVQLGSQMKTLTPGTAEYKVAEECILQEYEVFKKTCPGYWEEKQRCEYLHQKLSHIKELILNYEQNPSNS
uniref:Elongation factor for RNA polymerase II 3 n=1 Tax=Latimeria chalumnae TaxID=7897 RepID=M3XH49_LATCH|nr:PREDICTED: RNA polymerase II elongation factor ELL3 [Latimeria chalumnae]|eukprot:XP_005989805.1 PREDICTED: RNA polymerase II elongation factor ELL3 [Latimeria chalumnae]